MLSFGCLAGFLSYMPFILRSIALLLIVLCSHMFWIVKCVLRVLMASFVWLPPNNLSITGVDKVVGRGINRGETG